MADGPYVTYSRRSETCRIYGHYWNEHKGGTRECSWCRSRAFAWYAEPSYWRCLLFLFTRGEK